LLGGRAGRWNDRGLPTVRVTGSTVDQVLGGGEPAATFETSDFELLRGFLGRRCPDQLRAWAAAGSDPAAVDAAVAAFPVFGPRPDPLVEEASGPAAAGR
jgi:hypothetical protein